MGCKSNSDTVSMSLDANFTTGASWQTAIADETVAVLESDEYVQKKANPGMVGVGGKQVLTFKCLREGESKITLKYCRPWEGGEVFEVRTGRIIVDKNLNGKIQIDEK